MKKLLSLMLALGLALSLIGCGGGAKAPDILGVYDTTIEFKNILVEEIDGEIGAVGGDISFADYVENFDIVIVSEFKEDGTYKQELDVEKFDATCEALKTSVLVYMEDVLVEILKQEFVAVDPTLVIESKEDIEELLGMTFDELASMSLGMSLEEYVNTIMDESFGIEEMGDEFVSEGKYKAEDGKLYMSDSLDTEIDKNVYEVYTIDGNVVTLTEGVNIEENEYVSYPIEMIKR